MELSKLLEARRVLLSHVNDKVSGTLAYKIMKFLKSSDGEEEFYSSKLNALVAEYSEKDEEGNPVRVEGGNIKIKSDKIQECENAVSSLGKTEVEVPSIVLTVANLSELSLSVRDAYALDGFIED